jgi:hypothetical protein
VAFLPSCGEASNLSVSDENNFKLQFLCTKENQRPIASFEAADRFKLSIVRNFGT